MRGCEYNGNWGNHQPYWLVIQNTGSWLLVGKDLNDSVAATGKPVGLQMQGSGGDVSREADQHF